MVAQTGLPSLPPLSIQGTSAMMYNNKTEDHTDFKNHEIELMAAGSMRETIGFFVNAVLSTSEAPGETELEEAFLVWRHALDTSVNARFGRLRPDISLWKANASLIESVPATMAPGAEGVDLSEPQSGFELNALLGPRLFAAVGIVDRDLSADKSQKECYGRVSYKIGGADYRAKEPDVDFDKEDIWDFLSVSFGAFGYSGKTLDPADYTAHDFYRAGLETGILYKKFSLMLGAVKGSSRFASAPPRESRATSAEIEYLFASKWKGLVRYDHASVEGGAAKRHYIPALVFAPLQVFKVTLSIDQETSDADTTTGMLSAQLAF